MKRRKLLSMVMALTLVTGAFVGCGSSADEKKIQEVLTQGIKNQ